MTEVIDKAKQKLEALEAEAAKLRDFIAVYAALSGDVAMVSGSQVEETSEDDEGATPAEIVESAMAEMRKRSRPMTRSQIVRALTENGLKLPGKDKNKNVGTVIWRSKKFDNIAGFGYWPKEFGGWLGQRPMTQTSLLGNNT